MDESCWVVGQVVKGKRAGTFVILGVYVREDETYLQLKAVNPADHRQMARGELTLPASAVTL